MDMRRGMEIIAAQAEEIDCLHAAIDKGLETIGLLTGLLLQYMSQEELERIMTKEEGGA